MDIKKVLEAVARVVGEGAQQQYNVQTLGPDFREQIAKIKIAEEAARRAQELHGFEVSEQSDAQRERGFTHAAELEQSGGDIPGFRAATAEDAADRARAAADALLESTIAGTNNKRLEPGFKREELDDADLDRGVREKVANRQASDAAAARSLDQRRLDLMERGQDRTQDRFDDRSHVGAGASEKINLLGSARMQTRELKALMADPKIAAEVGNVAGRFNGAQLAKAAELTDISPQAREVFVRVNRLFNDAAAVFGGKVLPPNEQARVGTVTPRMEDSAPQLIQKLLLGEDLYDKELKRRWLSLPAAGQRQMRRTMEYEGVDLSDLQDHVSGLDTNAMPLAPRQPPAGGGNPAVDAFLKKYMGNP